MSNIVTGPAFGHRKITGIPSGGHCIASVTQVRAMRLENGHQDIWLGIGFGPDTVYMRLCSFFALFGYAHAAAIRGLSIYGLETPSRDFVCSWKHPVSWYVDQWAQLGGNSIRVPFSYELVQAGPTWKIDDIINAAEKHENMSVMLDFHRVWADHQGPVPTEKISLDSFIETWRVILDRYKDHQCLIYAAIFNEYQGNDAGYWVGIMRGVLQKLEDYFPGRFHWVIGGTRWGGDLHGISLEDLPFSDRILYDVHKYIFSGSSTPADWDKSFGDYPEKVIVGEWGFKSQDWAQRQWANTFVKYLKERNVTDTYFWTIAHSGDTGGLWFDDCETLDEVKYDVLKSLWIS
jgi:endoglucanase